MQLPAVFITGPTASGKSEIGLQLAQHLGGEIVCIDSRTVYEGMDIGTAKAPPEERDIAPHHLLDIAKVDTPLSATDFRDRARASIADITSGGRLPILVGGASLYGDAVLWDFDREEPPKAREELESLTVHQLTGLLVEHSLPLPFNRDNHRSLVGYAELYAGAVRRTARVKAIRLGVERSRDDLVQRIKHRTANMVDQGLEDEVRGLVEQHGWNAILSSTIGYREFRPYLDGKTSTRHRKPLSPTP